MKSISNKNIIRIVLLFFVVIVLITKVTAQTGSAAGWKNAFATPPDSVKPSVYWYWMSDNESEDGVRKDIEAMHKIGIGRAFIGNIGYPKEEVPYGKVKLFSDEWWKITETAITTATRVGIDIGMFNSPGWSQSGGPWIKPTQTMRYIYGEEIRVKGPKQLSQKIVASKQDFQDVSVLAFPAPASDNDLLSAHSAIIKADNISNAQQMADGNIATEVIFPSRTPAVTIDIELPQAFTARSFVIYFAARPFKGNAELLVNENGSFRSLKKFAVDRSNPSINVGFIPFAPLAVSFDVATGKQYRLQFTDLHNQAGIAEIKLSGAPVIERYMEKQLAKMFQTPLPLWNEYQWPVQAEPELKSLVVDPSKVINISSGLSKEGLLKWNVPAGEWIIIRYGMVPTGVTNSPASPEGQGPELDKMNREFMEHHFDSFIGKVQSRIKPENRKAFKWVVADSYETGSQNWTNGMADDFKKQYGYDPLPWLPVLSGRVVSSADQSNRFLWDLRRLIADKVSYQYVGGLRDVSNKHGLKLWLENYGHWGFPGEFLQYGGQSDEIGGEFWNEGDLGSIECKAASSSAHIYGKNKVSAESFTAGGLAYVRYPALLKKRGDWSFTEGINNTLLHVFIEQPYDDKVPGVNAGFGTEFNRNNTWFYQGKAFVDYLRRCNFLLQQGNPVNDIAYFIGEDAPKMTGVRNPELPRGFQYDYINAEVIEKRLQVKDGKLVLPNGITYRILVLPQLETMRPALLKKIAQLVKDGAVIYSPAPKRSPSLQNFPAADGEIKKLSAEIWGKVDGVNSKSAAYGKGKVTNGRGLSEVLTSLQVGPDCSFDSSVPALYTHRKTTDADIYFVTNQSDKKLSFNCHFRVAGKQPEWWDAVNGTSRILPQFTQDASGTDIPLVLEPFQSGFIIFKEKASPAQAGSRNFPEPKQLLKLGEKWTLTFDTARRGPADPVVFNQLEDWSKRSEDNIKNYSGTVLYTTSFKAPALPKGERFMLNLGSVKVMAKVTLNGKEMGTAWTAPWQIDVTGALKEGENLLKVEVVNTWVNRLIGDSKLPAAERKTWTNVNPYRPTSAYDPSGLMGPVQLLSYVY
jgi:hypothetical protein